jgi:hypothetical protein
MSEALRAIALRVLDGTHSQRNESHRRLWAARDAVARAKWGLLDAQAQQAMAQRDFDRDQEFLRMIWSDIRPLSPESDSKEGPE